MNRRRSDGQALNSAGSSSWQQRQNLQNLSQNNQNLTQKPSLLSMKSQPNLSQADDVIDTPTSEKMTSPRGLTPQHNLGSSSMLPRSLSASGYGLNAANSVHKSVASERVHSADMYTADMKTPSTSSHTRHSLPAHNLQRYQPDYENLSHLGTAPLRSEKISELEDFDEVTGKDSMPSSPEVKQNERSHDPLAGHGVPTRDSASIKFVKVNQNHEKYPSWPVSQASTGSDSAQAQAINTRAQSMTDNTNTSKEFPKKQTLAYQPGLRPLVEKNSPTPERKGEDRNKSDPGFKSEFVFDHYRRVLRKTNENPDHRFEEFYNNSKSGYPPPKMDSDGHNIEDKDYNAPSPPERDTPGVDGKSLTSALTGVSQDRLAGNSESRLVGRPSNLNLGTNPGLVDSGTSPMDSTSPRVPHGQGRYSFPTGVSGIQKTRPGSGHLDHVVLREKTEFTQERPGSYPQRPSSHKNPRDLTVLRDSGLSRGRPGSSSRSYIVKSTPYYNTSTQTDNMLPYAVKISEPHGSVSGRPQTGENKVGELATQTSPMSPEDYKKQYGEKSVQARMSKEFQNSELDFKKPDRFQYPSLSQLHASPFQGIESIQAKYATDETPDVGDNSASILRKLSEEFYGKGHGQEKRIHSGSSQEPSPRPEPQVASPMVQPGMREAESYSSVVIHHNESNGLFGRDDFGSVTSMADSRQDISLSFADVSSNNKNLDMSQSRSRRSLDPSFSSVKSRYFSESKPGLQHQRDLSVPNLSTVTTTPASRDTSVSAASVLSKTHFQSRDQNFSTTTSSGPEQSIYSQPRCSTSDLSSTQSISFSGVESTNSQNQYSSSPSSLTTQSITTQSPSTNLHPSTSQSKSKDSNHIVQSDSTTEDKDDEVFFTRKPSLRKAYGIYDETERLIAQSKLAGKDKSSVGQLQASTPATAATDLVMTPISYPISRSVKYSESLTQIKEEADHGNNPGPQVPDNPTSTSNDLKSNYASNYSKVQKSGKGQPVKYAWQNEDWLKRSFNIPKGSNLKRTTSEQIPMPKLGQEVKTSSFDTESAIYANPSVTQPHIPRTSATGQNYDNSEHSVTSSGIYSDLSVSTHSRGQSEDLSRPPTDTELKKLQQQAVLSFYQRKTNAPSSPTSPACVNSLPATPHSADSSLYESIGGQSTSGQRSPSESVADIISKAHENLAKSAQRVDSIRRSNSRASTSSAEYMEMRHHDRLRKETDWSRLRSSGSFRYSPDPDKRGGSNRNSFASEGHHYEDISLFSPSTPRSSVSERWSQVSL